MIQALFQFWPLRSTTVFPQFAHSIHAESLFKPRVYAGKQNPDLLRRASVETPNWLLPLLWPDGSLWVPQCPLKARTPVDLGTLEGSAYHHCRTRQTSCGPCTNRLWLRPKSDVRLLNLSTQALESPLEVRGLDGTSLSSITQRTEPGTL